MNRLDTSRLAVDFAPGKAEGRLKLAPKSPVAEFIMLIEVTVHSVGSFLAHLVWPAVF